MDVPVRCLRSHPAHPHFLSRQYSPPPSNCFACGSSEPDDWHYYCDVCEVVFHQFCRFMVTGITHPYHLEHLLSYTIRISETEIVSFNNQSEFSQFFSGQLSSENVVSDVESHDGCDWCGEDLSKNYFRCLECGFSLNPSCIKKDPPLTITNPKSHQHPLTLFPRPLSVLCNACGLSDKIKDKSKYNLDKHEVEFEEKNKEPAYVCLQCNYFVHESCIDLPRVIKLTRHPHRLSLTPYLPPPATRSCGVCHSNVDVKRGMYSCNKGCTYAIHSKCATHTDIWDGIDLEGVPEEDLSPFVEVGHNLIKHFIHEHHLRFSEDHGLDLEGNKECQACCGPVGVGGFYSCTILHCDFFLHAPCANFPKKKEHPVHKHRLSLQPVVSYDVCNCLACGRAVSGFMYRCLNDACKDDNLFAMDVGCASVCEPFEHKVHQHPMFLFSGRDSSSICGICGEERESIYTLKCNDCRFTMCFKCATIPVVIRYKHDEHPLTLSTGEDSSDPYWCEKCEIQVDSKKWFYTCNQCCITLHVDCVFEDSSFVKIGWIMMGAENELTIALKFSAEDRKCTFASNIGNSRPVCQRCGLRCLYSGVFKFKDFYICSFHCLQNCYDEYMKKKRENENKAS